MLNIIYGKASSGKTDYVNGVLASLAKEGCEDLLLIVPEQFSFTAERTMLSLLGPEDCNRVEVVMSFSHIAETVRKEYGSSKLKEISSSEKILLMSMAINAVRDKLDFFARRVSSKGFAEEMISLCDEFKQNALLPENALEFSKEVESRPLSRKLSEVSIILESYNALLENRFSDPFDTLSRLYEVLGEYLFFENKTVVIDGFYSFSRQEIKIIERILSQAKDVYVTVCADEISLEKAENYDIFSFTRKTVRILYETAKRYNVPTRKVKVERDGEAFSPELDFLEQNVFRIDKEEFSEKPENVEIFTAKNIENECRYVALRIKKLLYEGKARCRDIAVVSRDGQGYDTEIKEALKKYGIEVFSDKLRNVKIQPLCTYISSALEIAAYGMNVSRVMKCLKTGLTDLDTEEISRLENYALMWGFSAPFERQWKENPRGFGEKINDDDEKELEELNRLRKIAAEPLIRFRKSFEDGISGRKAAEEIFALLECIHADENLKKLAISLEDEGEEELALEQERIWEKVISILDSFAQVVADDKKTAAEILDLFDIIISNEKIGVLPQGLDEVLVGNAERTRVSSPKIIFVVGANEGVFPRTPRSSGIFSDRERNLLLAGGLPLNAPVLDRILEERFIAYHTLCSATEKVCVSYSAKSTSEDLFPSEIISEIKSVFPCCTVSEAEKTDVYSYVFSESTAFDAVAETWKSDDGRTNALKKYFSEKEDFAEKTEALEKYLSREKVSIKDSETAKNLFGRNMFLSASRIESYYKCPFGYFCRYGLKAQPEEKAEISPRQRGTVVHHCLEILIKEYGLDTLKTMENDELRKIISEILRDYAETFMGGAGDKSMRFDFLYSRFEKTVYELIVQIIEEFSVSDFVPCGFELSIDRDSDDVPIYEIELETGRIFVRGSVDRVDMMEKGSEKYIRVVDYKTGGKDFRLYEVLEGINMQMLIYLFAIQQNGRNMYEDCIPAGVLYKPAKFGQIRVKRYASDAELEKERKKDGKYSGLVLANEDVIMGMDKEMTGDIIGVKIVENKDNTVSFKGSVATLTQMGKLKMKVDSIIAQMGNSLHSGRIEVMPFAHSSDRACTFCDYKDVCMWQEGDECRQSVPMKNDEIYLMLGSEEEKDG